MILELGGLLSKSDLNLKIQDFVTLFTLNDSNSQHNSKIEKIVVKLHQNHEIHTKLQVFKGF